MLSSECRWAERSMAPGLTQVTAVPLALPVCGSLRPSLGGNLQVTPALSLIKNDPFCHVLSGSWWSQPYWPQVKAQVLGFFICTNKVCFPSKEARFCMIVYCYESPVDIKKNKLFVFMVICLSFSSLQTQLETIAKTVVSLGGREQGEGSCILNTGSDFYQHLGHLASNREDDPAPAAAPVPSRRVSVAMSGRWALKWCASRFTRAVHKCKYTLISKILFKKQDVKYLRIIFILITDWNNILIG